MAECSLARETTEAQVSQNREDTFSLLISSQHEDIDMCKGPLYVELRHKNKLLTHVTIEVVPLVTV